MAERTKTLGEMQATTRCIRYLSQVIFGQIELGVKVA